MKKKRFILVLKSGLNWGMRDTGKVCLPPFSYRGKGVCR